MSSLYSALADTALECRSCATPLCTLFAIPMWCNIHCDSISPASTLVCLARLDRLRTLVHEEVIQVLVPQCLTGFSSWRRNKGISFFFEEPHNISTTRNVYNSTPKDRFSICFWLFESSRRDLLLYILISRIVNVNTCKQTLCCLYLLVFCFGQLYET
jgi:hypothetical protein